ncbi:MAG: hypothetical protein LC725_08050 [Lentisphaerae bacterium]|nr:hypothetical protein [Lentisphaerota bacterium]
MREGKLYAVTGASRSGKSAWTKHRLADYSRVLIWDVKGEYQGVTYRPTTKTELAQCIKTLAGKPGAVAYTAGKLADFDYFCRAAQMWIKTHYLAGQRCALVIEETADVTSPSKAPEAYGILLRRYLAYGVDMFAITQRPAESDKTSIGNASQVHICRMTLDRDRKAVAANCGVPLDAIAGLIADQDAGRFDYINADLGAGKWRAGTLTWANNRPKFTPKGAAKPI